MPEAQLEVRESRHARQPIEYHYQIEMRQPEIVYPRFTTNKDPRAADFLAEVKTEYMHLM